jgi:phosphate butyryltransferase
MNAQPAFEQLRWERLQTVSELVEIAGRMDSSTVVIAGGDRKDDLKLVESARDHGIIDRIVLIGRTERIREEVDALGIEIPEQDVIDAQNDEEVASATVDLVKMEAVNIVLKGNISTPVINRHMISLAVRPTVSLASIFDAAPIAGGRPMILTDAGVTTVCNFGRMVDLILNAVEVARLVMGVAQPRVAVLSANEKQIPSLSSTWIGERLSIRKWENAVVYGPLSFDLATDPQSVAIKGLPHTHGACEVAGQADILVCPGIDSANILYKTISALCKYGEASIAGITVGFPVPYIILSRSDSLDTRLESIALCSIYAQRKLLEKRKSEKATASKPFWVLCLTERAGSISAALFENDRCVSCDLFPVPPFQVKAGETSLKPLIESLKSWIQRNSPAERVDAVAAAAGCSTLRGTQAVLKGLYSLSDILSRKRRGGIKPKKGGEESLLLCAGELANSYGVQAFFTHSCLNSPKSRPISGGIFLRAEDDTPIPVLGIQHAVKTVARQTLRPEDDLNVVVAQLGPPFCVAAVVRGKLCGFRSGILQRRHEGSKTSRISSRNAEAAGEQQTRKTSAAGFCELEHAPDTLKPEDLERWAGSADLAQRRDFERLVQDTAGEIGRMFVLAGGDVESIVLSGTLVESEQFRSSLRSRVSRLAPVLVLRGNPEQEALASKTIDILCGRGIPLPSERRTVHSRKEKHT